MCSARRFAVVALAAALALGASAPPAAAVPIGVRAKTRVELEHKKSPSGAVLVGRLLDDAAQPVAAERITLELPGLTPFNRITDDAGRFEVPLSTRELARLRSEGELVTWTVRYDGSSRLGEATEEGTLDLSKRSTRLEVQVGTAPPGQEARVVLGEQPIAISVSLTDTSGRAPRPIPQAEVALEVGRGSQLVGATGTSGAVTFVVRPSALAGGGRYPIRARFSGDAMHAASRAGAALVVLLPTRVTLRVVREGDERQGRYRMSGRVSDQHRPLAGEIVTVAGLHGSGPAFELVAATDRDGVFVAALGAAELEAIRERLADDRRRVRLEIQAAFRPADGLHAPARSASVALDIPHPPGVPLSWYLAGLGVVVAVIALTRALRSGALARALAALLEALRRLARRLREGRLRPATPTDVPAFVTRYDPPGAPLARTSDRLSGWLVDAHTRHPIPGRVTVRAGADERVAQATADGRFAIGPLPPGPCSVTVESPGYLARELALELPHDGDYDGAHWALVAVHRSVRELFAGALDALGRPLAWGYATPREAARDALEPLHPSAERPVVEPPLAELTHLVERTHFAAHAGSAADVERARTLREAVRRAPAAPPGEPGGSAR